jgi:hypothetical protein
VGVTPFLIRDSPAGLQAAEKLVFQQPAKRRMDVARKATKAFSASG